MTSNKEYIEREATCKDCAHYCVCKDTLADENWDENAPKEVREMFSPSGCENYKPAADVVEVVRCKDCQYKSEWVKNGIGEYFCRRSGLWNLTDECYCHCGAKIGEGKK